MRAGSKSDARIRHAPKQCLLPTTKAAIVNSPIAATLYYSLIAPSAATKVGVQHPFPVEHIICAHCRANH
jgi:hypothetical protein